eukprot:Gb_16512 [translate_table: standard]
MELFHKAKTVRLRGHHDKYLWAEEDEESVSQDRDGAKQNARWKVEFIEGSPVIRLKSRYDCYLTATDQPFLLGMTGKKVQQTLPSKLDSSVEWEPIREGFHVKLKTRYGNYLRANGGLPPWRNSVTHDIPHRTATQEWILWEVEVMEIVIPESPVVLEVCSKCCYVILGFGSATVYFLTFQRLTFMITPPELYSEVTLLMAFLQSVPSLPKSPPRPDGRLIYYAIGDEHGNIEDDHTWPSFFFKGNDLPELTKQLEEETGLQDVVVCARHPLNGELYPLRLRLPPNNSAMHLVLVQASSKCEFLHSLC